MRTLKIAHEINRAKEKLARQVETVAKLAAAAQEDPEHYPHVRRLIREAVELGDFLGQVETLSALKRRYEPSPEVRDAISAALDSVSGCCLDNTEEFVKVREAVMGALAGCSALEILFDVDDGCIVIGENFEVTPRVVNDAKDLVKLLEKHGCRVHYTEHK
jgi:hypothetical protein